MIEPIGSEGNRISPYDRYTQYSQYSKPDSASRVNSPWDEAADRRMQGQATAPGQVAPQSKPAPPGFAGQPGQVMQPGQTTPGMGPNQGTIARKPVAVNAATPTGKKECQTCNSRKYQDGSDDPGVSYQTPTKISPEKAGAAVKAHEKEHVGRERAKAAREEREVVSQSVVFKTAICPECGRVYISGGTTTTVTRAKNKDAMFQTGAPPVNVGFVLDENV